ncbi:hypothetical protein BDV11DRAFT_174782 [Aspergillus similis]
MSAWWKCSRCQNFNNPELCGGRCTVCGHIKCAECARDDGYEAVTRRTSAASEDDGEFDNNLDSDSDNIFSDDEDSMRGARAAIEDDGHDDEDSMRGARAAIEDDGQFDNNLDNNADTTLSDDEASMRGTSAAVEDAGQFDNNLDSDSDNIFSDDEDSMRGARAAVEDDGQFDNNLDNDADAPFSDDENAARGTSAATDVKGQFDNNLANNADTEIANDWERERSEDSSQDSDATSSVFSNESRSSQSSAEMGDMKEAGTSILVKLLSEDKLITTCCHDALHNAMFRPGRVQRKLRRLLKRCATNLKQDQLIAQYDREILVPFIKRYSHSASNRFCMALRGSDEVLSLPLDSVPDGRDPRAKAEQYLKRARGRFALSDRSVPATGYESESDSDSEEDEDDMLWLEFPNLNHLRRVLVGCAALRRLRHDLLYFVYPSLDKRVKRLAARFTDPAHPEYLEYRRYGWARVVVEMRCYVPGTILLDHPQRGGWMNTVQGAVEAWTGMRWDWWPLKPYMRNLSEHERRVSWTCACGEERWMELPAPFVDGLKQCMEDHIAMETRIQTLKQALIDSLEENRGAAASSHGPSSLTLGQSPPSMAFQQANSGLAASSIPIQMDPTNIHPASKTTSQPPQAIERYVLLLVRRSNRHCLSQIRVHRSDDNAFFQTLRSDYCRLRGWLRNYLSVWRYSHCDFYQFEKFDDSRYAPKLKDDYPKSRDHYEYNPYPMDIVPPITDHEFNSRFYECYCSNKHRLLHFFHPCKKASGHSCDALQLLPKKKTQLEQHGDKRQPFWGIYAQEIVCFRWVVAYHVVCLLPMVVFFFLWMFPLGFKGDLQDAAVPLTLMLGMLSLFWSLFLGSIRFGSPT